MTETEADSKKRTWQDSLLTGLATAFFVATYHILDRAWDSWWSVAVPFTAVLIIFFALHFYSRRRTIAAIAIVAAVVLIVVSVTLAKPWHTPDAPLQPTGLTLVSDDGSLQVSWDASPSRGTFRFGYLLRWKSSTQSWDDATIKKLGDSATSYMITGLTNGTVYNVLLNAHNLGGYSTEVTAIATPQ